MNTPQPPQQPALEGRVAFLLSQLGYYTAERFAERLRPLGLQPRHFGLLMHLLAADGQSQQQLADRMDIHRNLMVGLVDDLEDRGLVKRRRHPMDRRAHAVHLTAEAHQMLPQAQAAADALESEIVGLLGTTQQKQLLALLQHLALAAGLAAGVHPGLRTRGSKQPDC